MRGCTAGCLLDILHVGCGILEQFWNFLKKLGNWKGTGKNRGPFLNKRKGKERFPFFCLEDRKGPHSRKNGQVNMYDG